MGQFKQPVKLERMGIGAFKVVEPFEFYTTHVGNDFNEVMEMGSIMVPVKRYRVPEGYEARLDHMPKWIWSMCSPEGKWGKAMILHHYLYQHAHGRRRRSDLIFKDSLKVLGSSFWHRNAMYGLVRGFGMVSFHYNKLAKELSASASILKP